MRENEHGCPTFDAVSLAEFERRKLRDNRVVLLSGDIDSGGAHVFIEDIEMLALDESREDVIIIITTPGGNVFNGLAIVRAIRRLQKLGIKVIGEVYGQAMSMGFFVLQCCDERRMGSFCTLMCHGITTGFVGDQRAIEQEQKLIEGWNVELSQLIANRCTADGEYKESGYWYEILRDNTPMFYSSTECLKMGLIDLVHYDNLC